MLTQDREAGDNQATPVKRQRQSREKKARIASVPKVCVPSSARPSKRAKASPALLSMGVMPSSRSISQDEVGQASCVIHTSTVDLISEIRETHRRRQDFHRAEKSLTLQIKAIERRLGAASFALSPNLDVPRDSLNGAEGHDTDDNHSGYADGSDLLISEGHHELADQYVVADADGEEGDQYIFANHATGVSFFATFPLVEARVTIKKQRMVVERECVKLAKQLPVYAAFVEPINGVGALGLAQIIGEAGDLSNYSNPAKLWKRMGLAVINGKSQRRVAGAGALEQGYSPVRRAIMFCIGDSMLKKQNAYRELYLARKVLEQAKVPDGTKMLWHRRAQRYAEKRLLRDLWRAWRGQIRSDHLVSDASPGSPQ